MSIPGRRAPGPSSLCPLGEPATARLPPKAQLRKNRAPSPQAPAFFTEHPACQGQRARAPSAHGGRDRPPHTDPRSRRLVPNTELTRRHPIFYILPTNTDAAVSDLHEDSWLPDRDRGGEHAADWGKGERAARRPPRAHSRRHAVTPAPAADTFCPGAGRSAASLCACQCEAGLAPRGRRALSVPAGREAAQRGVSGRHGHHGFQRTVNQAAPSVTPPHSYLHKSLKQSFKSKVNKIQCS